MGSKRLRFEIGEGMTPDTTIELSNKRKLEQSKGYLSLSCPVCSVIFERKASEAKRHQHSYCGRGCCGMAQRRQVEIRCKVCSKPFTVKRSMVGHITCCGPECKSSAQTEVSKNSALITEYNTQRQRSK